MPNKKKKEPKNSFYFFMLKYRKDAEAKGRRFSGMAEVANAAGPIWSSMTSAQKSPYEEMAKQAKLRDKTDLENKFTSQGISYAQLEREEKERKEKEERMIRYITKTVKSLDLTSESNQRFPFYFAHVNYYCHRDGTYYPCEIAVARFTLRKGIEDTFHSFIELDQIPSGYLYEAMKISQETHQIPLPPNKGERNYYKLLTDIRNFLMENQDGNELPPLYTMPAFIDPVSNVLEFLENSSDYEIVASNFRVYPINKLFYELRKACAKCVGREGFPAESLALVELEKDMFNYTPRISCDFHEFKDCMQYCSLSFVKRWCFMISDHCCQDIRVTLIPGSHVPIMSDISKVVKSMPEPESERSSIAIANGAIPKPKPMTITLIDHGKEAEKTSRQFNISGAGDMPSTRIKDPPPPPLRQPNTMPKALAGVLRQKEVKFTPEDFPAIGGGNGVIGKIPMAVAGRGRGNVWQRQGPENPIGCGRGLVASLAGLNIKEERKEE